ncbi:MAG: 3TM-type holin [Alphaproteobacteria bacterium]
MQWLVNLLGGGLLQGLDAMLARFAGNKDAAEANLHSEQIAAIQSAAAEFAPRENRTRWDSFIDGLNRLPRPLLAFMVIAVLVWAPLDPTGFARVMTAYGLIPEWLVIVMGQVILLFCGGRMLERWPGRLAGPSAQAVQSTLALMDDLRRREQPAPPSAPPSAPSFAPSSAAESNPSLRAWLAASAAPAAAAPAKAPEPRPFDGGTDGP